MNTNRFASTMGVLLPSFLLLAVAGCSATDNGPGGASGSAGSGGGGNSSETALTFDHGGFVAKGPTTKGVQGPFYGYGDGSGDMKCQGAGYPTANCSNVMEHPGNGDRAAA